MQSNVVMFIADIFEESLMQFQKQNLLEVVVHAEVMYFTEHIWFCTLAQYHDSIY